MWGSILLTKRPHPEALRAAVARVFGVAPGDVHVITRSSKQDTAAARVVVELTPVRGEFSALVDVYADADLEGRESLEGLALLCAELAVSAFVGDDSENPASGTLVSQAGQVTHAMIDPEGENTAEYRLMR